MGKGFTTPLYCETGRYASGHTGEEYWSSERQEDNRMHLVGKTVAELQKLVAQLNFNQDLQNNAVEHMVVRKLNNFCTLSDRQFIYEDLTPSTSTTASTERL